MISLKARALFALLAASLVVPIASAEIVYDNSTTPTKGVYDPLLPPNNLPDGYWAIDQVGGYNGDLVSLAGTSRLVTKFSVYLAALPAIKVTDLTIEFWNFDGNTPTTLFWSGSKTDIAVGADPTKVTFDDLEVLVPTDFVWMARTDGDQASEFGLATFDPPTVGSSPLSYGSDYYWNLDPDGWWNLNFNFGYPPQQKANFGATIEAVPEPCTMALLTAGGLFLVRRRRSL